MSIREKDTPVFNMTVDELYTPRDVQFLKDWVGFSRYRQTNTSAI